MLNEERIIMMTRMAAYESGEGKKDGAIGSYFRGDYIGLQVLKSVISATIAYFLVCGIYLLYHFETLLDGIYEMDLWGIARKAAIAYIVTVAVYALISYVVYSYKYGKAKKKQKAYMSRLRQLSQLYQLESKNKQSY
ncbi:MAG: hypothetical protein HDQ98_04375 [Lachnospiraceae bacterium]|nr:hypothetical protein [Lachnospiraceae bacterium]